MQFQARSHYLDDDNGIRGHGRVLTIHLHLHLPRQGEDADTAGLEQGDQNKSKVKNFLSWVSSKAGFCLVVSIHDLMHTECGL